MNLGNELSLSPRAPRERAGVRGKWLCNLDSAHCEPTVYVNKILF